MESRIHKVFSLDGNKAYTTSVKFPVKVHLYMVVCQKKFQDFEK